MNKKLLLISYHFAPSKAIGARRPTMLANYLANNNFDISVVCKKSLSEGSSPFDVSPAINIKSIYQHPGILNPLWSWFIKIRILLQRGGPSTSYNNNDEDSKNDDVVPLTKDSYSLVNETFKQKLRRYVLSSQALLDASKSWVLLSSLFILAYKLKGKKFDVVVTSGPTSNAHLLGLLAKKLFGASWVLDLRDPITIWDEIYPWCNSKWRRSIEDALEKLYIKHADRIVCTTPSLLTEIESNFPYASGKTELIYNGFDEILPEKPKALIGQLKLIYAGALYMNRNPLPLFEAIEELLNDETVDRNKLMLDLYGSCQEWNGIDLLNWVNQRNLTDTIRIHGSISPSEVQEKSMLSNVLVNFAQNQSKQIPAKTFDQIAICKEILLVSEQGSDTADLIQKQGFGRVVDSQKSALHKSLQELYQYYVTNGSEYPVMRENRIIYSRESMNEKYFKLLSSLS